MESQGKSVTPMNNNFSEGPSSADSSENNEPKNPVEVIRLGELFCIPPWKPTNNTKKTAKKSKPARSTDRRSKSRPFPSSGKEHSDNENLIASAVENMHHRTVVPFDRGAGIWRFLVPPIRKSSERATEAPCLLPRKAMRSPNSRRPGLLYFLTSRRSRKGQDLKTALIRGARKRFDTHGKMMKPQKSRNALSNYGRSDVWGESTVAERENAVKEAIKYCRNCYYGYRSS